MDIKSLQAATRAAVKPRFGRKRYLESKAIPHFPDSLEREYNRILNGYMKLLNSAIAAHLPRIRAALDGMHTDAKDPQDEHPAEPPTAAEIAAFNRMVDKAIDEMLTEFQYGQGLFDLRDKIQRTADLGHKLSIAEWRRMVKRTLGIDIMEDYYRGAQFGQLTERWIADNVGLIKTIPQDTLGKMRETVKSGFASGASTKTIAQQIQDAYSVSKNHARFIARDQAAKLNAQITRQQQQDAGVTEYVWRTTGDSRVRDRHRELNGKRFKYSDPPEVDPRTGRRENPGGDYQCRCVALPVFDIDEVVLPWSNAEPGYTPAAPMVIPTVKPPENNESQSGLTPVDNGSNINMGSLDQVLGTEHTSKMTAVLKKAPADARAVWNKYSDRLTIANTKSPRSYCDSSGVNIDLDKAARKEFASNGELARNPYYSLWHEFGHNIDRVVRKERGELKTIGDSFKSRVHTKKRTGGYSLTEMLNEEGWDYIKATRARLEAEAVAAGGKASDVYRNLVINTIKDELADLPLIASIDIGDLWGAIAGEPMARYGHAVSYWKKISVGNEAFAEMFSAKIMNPDSLKQIKRYFPKSYEIFEEILSELGGVT